MKLQRSITKQYETRGINIGNPPDLLPAAMNVILSVPSFVAVDLEKSLVAWRGQNWLNHPRDSNRMPVPVEQCFPEFLELAQSQSPQKVGEFVERWGPLERYPFPCELEKEAATCESVALYIGGARWCQAVLDVAGNLGIGAGGKRSDWNTIRVAESCTPPAYELTIEQQRNTLLSDVTNRLQEADVVPYLQEEQGKIIVTLGCHADAPLQRAWDKAQEEGRPIMLHALAPWLSTGMCEYPMPRPSVLWGSILLRLATILANPHGVKRCKNLPCQNTFTPEHHNQKYCQNCGEASESNRRRVAKFRKLKKEAKQENW